MRTILKDHDAPRIHFTTDEEEIERDVLLAAFCNGTQEGGGFLLAPDAKNDDGMLDYVLVDRVSRLMMFRLIPEFLRGTHRRFQEVHTGRFRELKLTADRPLIVHTDGEVYARARADIRELSIRIHPEALSVVL